MVGLLIANDATAPFWVSALLGLIGLAAVALIVALVLRRGK